MYKIFLTVTYGYTTKSVDYLIPLLQPSHLQIQYFKHHCDVGKVYVVGIPGLFPKGLLITRHQCIGTLKLYGPRQANLVLIAYASSEGSGEPAHSRSLARTFAARSYKQ